MFLRIILSFILGPTGTGARGGMWKAFFLKNALFNILYTLGRGRGGRGRGRGRGGPGGANREGGGGGFGGRGRGR